MSDDSTIPLEHVRASPVALEVVSLVVRVSGDDILDFQVLSLLVGSPVELDLLDLGPAESLRCHVLLVGDVLEAAYVLADRQLRAMPGARASAQPFILVRGGTAVVFIHD